MLTVAQVAERMQLTKGMILAAMELFRRSKGEFGLAFCEPASGQYRIHPQNLEDWERRMMPLQLRSTKDQPFRKRNEKEHSLP